jgi:hypothetical protein
MFPRLLTLFAAVLLYRLSCSVLHSAPTVVCTDTVGQSNRRPNPHLICAITDTAYPHQLAQLTVHTKQRHDMMCLHAHLRVNMPEHGQKGAERGRKGQYVATYGASKCTSFLVSPVTCCHVVGYTKAPLMQLNKGASVTKLGTNHLHKSPVSSHSQHGSKYPQSLVSKRIPALQTEKCKRVTPC